MFSSTHSSPVFESPTSSKFEMPLKTCPLKTSTPENSKLKKLYRHHIDPLKELELSHLSPRRILQPLEISRCNSNSSISIPFFNQFDDPNNTRHSVQSWPQDGFTHPKNNFRKFQVDDHERVQSWPQVQDEFTHPKSNFRKNLIDAPERPDLHFEEFNDPFCSNKGNPDAEDMASPSMQRLLNEQGLCFTANFQDFKRFSI